MTSLYVSDMDWTLLQADSSLSAFSRETLNGLLADGLQFTVASARSVVSMRERLHGLALQLPVIESNGAYISDLATGQHLVVNAIEESVASAVYDQILRSGIHPLVGTFDGQVDRLYFDDGLNAGSQWLIDRRRLAGDPRLAHLVDMEMALREQVVVLTAIARLDEIERISAEISAEFGEHLDMHFQENQYEPGWFWLSIHSQRATKAHAIRTLREMRGLVDAETVVFGDHANDAHMFANADRAIAVENAIPTIKTLATQIIGSHADDSVVKFIQADFLRNGT